MVPAVSLGRGLVQMDALHKLGYRGYPSRQGSVLGSKSPGRQGVSELDK